MVVHQCDICNRTFYNRRNLLNHKEKVNCESLIDRTKCPYCFRIFSSKQRRDTHISSSRCKPKAPDDDDDSFTDEVDCESPIDHTKCPHCFRKFSSKQRRDTHIGSSRCKPKAPDNSFTDKVDCESPIDHTKCPHCFRKFSSKQRRDTHISSGMCEPKAPDDSLTDKDKDLLKIYQNLNNSSGTLNIHLNTVKGVITERQCPQCLKDFSSKQELEYHIDKQICIKNIVKDDEDDHKNNNTTMFTAIQKLEFEKIKLEQLRAEIHLKTLNCGLNNTFNTIDQKYVDPHFENNSNVVGKIINKSCALTEKLKVDKDTCNMAYIVPEPSIEIELNKPYVHKKTGTLDHQSYKCNSDAFNNEDRYNKPMNNCIETDSNIINSKTSINRKQTGELYLEKRDCQKQRKFRESLITKYGGCQITGVAAVYCDAAHIIPYKTNQDFDISNGLLLRCDLHRAFDKGYLTIDYETGEVKFDDSSINGKKLILSEKTKCYLKLKHLNS